MVEIKVRGVGRVADDPRSLLLCLSEMPTDDDIRSLHDFLASWRPRKSPLQAIADDIRAGIFPRRSLPPEADEELDAQYHSDIDGAP